MTNTAAETAKKTAQEADSSKETALDRRYGAIGISAVAAAARYQGDAKNSAYAPVAIGWYEPADEAA
jgi:hypothetical protein